MHTQTSARLPIRFAALAALAVFAFASVTAVADQHGKKGDKMAAKADIVDTAVAAGQFKTLAAALQAAGLIETLKGPGPFTVFAPTDEAFAKLPAGTVEDLLKPENKDKLTSILTYHVVAGKVKAADVVKLKEAKTVQGGAVAIKTADGKVMVDGANVVKTDIGASNGVIHVIDAVILPKS
jgi:transforming growth factor-beta-induced protein